MEAGPRPARRWPFALAALGVLVVACLGTGGGAALATDNAASTAASLQARGQYGAAAALYDAIASRTGVLYVLARGTVKAAPADAQRALLAWATALARHGDIDHADSLIASITDPAVRADAEATRASLLLAAARAAAARGQYATALTHLQELDAAPAPAAARQTAAALMPQYQVGLAQSLAAAGHGNDAVTLLDSVAREGATAAAAAQTALPTAIWAAAQEDLADQAVQDAAAAMQRLEQVAPGSSMAAQAATALAAPQPVSGTLVDRAGRPITAQVRLSTHFFAEPGGYYTTGPFYYGSSDSSGNFRLAAIPQGGPYVLEVNRGGDWETFVDPATGQPSQPVTIAPLQPVNLTFIALT